MKTIVNMVTGKVLYATLVEIQLAENEIAIDELLVDPFENPHFNFENRTFYDLPVEE
jgi:hypothetical protein